MDRITVSLEESQIAMIKELSGDDGPYESQSEAVRYLIQRSQEAESLENELADTKRQLREVNAHNDDVEELAEYVSEERRLQSEERERRRAPLLKRIEWLVFGYDERR